MSHGRQVNAAKFAVHRTETRRGSCARSVELLCATTTFESSTQIAETKALHALWFLLCSTFHCCHWVKDLSTSVVVVCRST